jgi:hypothetical protein
MQSVGKDITLKVGDCNGSYIAWAEGSREMIRLIIAIGQVTRSLGKLDVVLGSKGGVSRWPEGDKHGKVQIELDANELDIGLAAIGHGTILNWKQN